jgi:hypothetical protein
MDYGRRKFDEDQRRRWPIAEARRILREARTSERQKAAADQEPAPRWRRRKEDRKRR